MAKFQVTFNVSAEPYSYGNVITVIEGTVTVVAESEEDAFNLIHETIIPTYKSTLEVTNVSPL